LAIVAPPVTRTIRVVASMKILDLDAIERRPF